MHHAPQMAATTIGNASLAIRDLCFANQQRLGITVQNAGDYDIFRTAVETAKKSIKGEGPKYVILYTLAQATRCAHALHSHSVHWMDKLISKRRRLERRPRDANGIPIDDDLPTGPGPPGHPPGGGAP